MIDLQTLDTLAPEQLRAAVRTLANEVQFKQATIDKLTHENAVLKRLKFAAKSESYSPEQKSLIEETLDTDLAALAVVIEALTPRKPPEDKRCPSARSSRPTCHAGRSATNPTTPPAAAASSL